MPIFAAEVQVAGIGEARANLLDVDATEFFVGSDREFKGGAFEVVDENFEIVGLNVGVLGRAAEEIIGMLDHKLIKGRGGRDVDGASGPGAAAGATRALPSRGDGAGVAGHDGGVERANVDAELKGVGSDDAANFSFAQAALDGAAFAGKITAAIAANGGFLAGARGMSLLQIGEHQLSVQAGIGKHDRLQVVGQQFFGDATGFVDVTASNTEIAIDNGRIIEDKDFFGRGRAVLIEDLNIRLGEAGGELAGIGDGGGATNKLRVGAVEAGDAAQAAKNVGEMTAQNAAVGVQLIENDVTEIFEEADPFRVVRENAGVDHVGIREDDVAAFANGFAGVAGRVAIVGEDAEGIVEARSEIVKLGELILSEGLGGVEVKGAGVGIFEDGIEDREVVANRFAGGSGRDDDHVASGANRFGGGGLVSVEAFNAFGVVGGYEIRANPVGHGCERAFAGGEVFDGGEDFAGAVASGKFGEDVADSFDGGARAYGEGLRGLSDFWWLRGCLRRLSAELWQGSAS